MAKRWVLILAPALMMAQTTVEEVLTARFNEQMRSYLQNIDGAAGYAAIDLTSGRVSSMNGDVEFTQASAIKIPILVTLYKDVAAGRLRMDERARLEAKDAVGGSGGLQQKLKEAPQTLTLGELCLLMMRDSDNTATNVLIAKAGMQRVNEMMESLGLRRTRLRRVMMDAAAAARGDENTSTPMEMARLAEMIYRGKVAGSAEILGLMKTVKAAVRGVVPAEVEVASKPGSVGGVHTETAIVYHPHRPFVIAVAAAALAEGTPDPIPNAARIAYGHFDRLGVSNAYGHRVR